MTFEPENKNLRVFPYENRLDLFYRLAGLLFRKSIRTLRRHWQIGANDCLFQIAPCSVLFEVIFDNSRVDRFDMFCTPISLKHEYHPKNETRNALFLQLASLELNRQRLCSQIKSLSPFNSLLPTWPCIYRARYTMATARANVR